MGEKDGYLPFPKGFETICVHHTPNIEKQSNKEMVTPIVTSNFYESKETNSLSKYVQARLGNPTRIVLENLVALLNNARYGLCFASGMGAISAILALLKSGDHIICSDDVYGGTNFLFNKLWSNFGICCSVLDFCHIENVEKAITPCTKLIWTENPTNPKMKIIDLCCTAEIGRRHNVITVTDNTVLTPFLQRPLEFGIDIVVHSLSKYMNGHSDIIMGSVCTNREDLYERLKYTQVHFGHIPSSLDCYQVIRGLKTLPQRMKRHQKNSLEVAKYLMSHPKIEEVIHPGLPCHPQHELFKSQTSGHSGLFGFYLKGNVEKCIKFMNNLEIFNQAVSLGGYESLLELPSLCSHKLIPKHLKKALQLTDNFIRMSVGLEDVCDLIKDLEQSLEKL